MPKTPKQLNTPIKNKFNYLSQSPKKTHCQSIKYYYNNTQNEFLNNKPINHWTEDSLHINWEYYIFLINQIHISSLQFKETGNWYHWNHIQKQHHILKTLINSSTNLTYLDPNQVKTLNETISKNFTQSTGKTDQAQSQKNQ